MLDVTLAQRPPMASSSIDGASEWQPGQAQPGPREASGRMDRLAVALAQRATRST